MKILLLMKNMLRLQGGHATNMAPLKEINTRACDLSDRSKKIEERKKRKGNTICLTSYMAWCSRAEKEERRFYREVERENVRRKEKRTELEEKREKKENFVTTIFVIKKRLPTIITIIKTVKSQRNKKVNERSVFQKLQREHFVANIVQINYSNGHLQFLINQCCILVIIKQKTTFLINVFSLIN